MVNILLVVASLQFMSDELGMISDVELVNTAIFGQGWDP